ncbi:MAG: hypothetical protein Q9209_004301 [Squamulea sp. 1 TL-2023]
MPAWAAPGDKDNGFINPGNYSNPDIICHKDATPGELYATVAAGSTVQLQWAEWPESHHGPVIDYLANCNGECTSVEKTALKFNKIDGEGLRDWTTMPGNWASDELRAANNSWTVTIPKSVAPGNYVLRHEIIALHSSHNPDGAQNYPQCVNLKVTGSGTDKLASGTLGIELYKPDDAGIFLNIYEKLSTYTVPGPKLYSGASSPDTPVTTSSADNGSPSSTTSTGASSVGGYGTVSPVQTSSTTIPTNSPPYPTSNSNSTSPILTKSGKKVASKKPCTSKTANTVPTSGSLPSYPEATGSSLPETPSEPTTSPSVSTTTTPPSTPSEEGTNTNPTPSKSKFSVMTTAELFEWLECIIAELRSRLGGKTRRHAREFLGL